MDCVKYEKTLLSMMQMHNTGVESPNMLVKCPRQCTDWALDRGRKEKLNI